MPVACFGMVTVEKLSKRYGSLCAVSEVDFEVGKGEIVGLLGPNGAGKSTTMKMLAGYLPPTSGRATIAGYDVFSQSLQARRRIGYMPENVPLYPDMRVREFLSYRAALKGVPGRRLRERTADVIELCGLQEVATRIIGRLSKGYRQRVGLADAMSHEPDLLILDEPTIGLDPNQIRAVRGMIRNLRRHHTILISTHILPEVEMLCSKVVILKNGRVQAAGTPAELRAGHGQAGLVEFDAVVPDPLAAAALLRADSSIQSVTHRQDGAWTVFSIVPKPAHDPRENLFRTAVENHWRVREISRPEASLEHVFAELTGGEDWER